MKSKIYKLQLILAGILLSTATAFTNVAINATNFPDENFRNWLLEQTWGSDGVITEAEIADITLISIHEHDRNISDLTGINLFTNLRYLWIDNLPLTSLDISALTNLEMLFIFNTQLTSLDVSALINLEGLFISNTQLTSLDVSALINLQGLSISNTQLTSLDLSTLINLEGLLISNTQLNSLDLSTLINLEGLFYLILS